LAVHICPVPEQLPHEATLREAPQLSVTEIAPHCAPTLEHSAGSFTGVQPQWFAMPAPPHDWPVPEHAPHEGTLRMTPQLSTVVSGPHSKPAIVHSWRSVNGVQPQWLGTLPPPQDWPVPPHAPHEGMLCIAPQLSTAVMAPHSAPAAAHSCMSLCAVQPQWFVPASPPPQLWPVPVHAPHIATFRAAPQLSMPVTAPHCAPASAQKSKSLSGAQPQRFAPASAPPQL
jgi:hypothetical protein